MTKKSFLPGIDVLTGLKKSWIDGKRVGLVGHPAAVGSQGAPSIQLLSNAGARLTALFGCEHGFFGTERAGKQISDQLHPLWQIPVYSLFGSTKRPTAAMLENLDSVVFDMQDLGARFYTYVSTLRYILESASLAHKEVIVADRPIPLPRTVDGPMLDEKFASFVACIPAPPCYGMTLGETALWLKDCLKLDLELKVAPMQNYHRQSRRGPDWPPWIPTSPGIRSWETAYCYMATVSSEAMALINVGRGSNMIFQVISVPGISGADLCKSLNQCEITGVMFYPFPYKTDKSNDVFDGARMVVQKPDSYLPIAAGIAIIAEIQKIIGLDALWKHAGTREEWFDKLHGTDTVRLALQAGEPAGDIIRSWQKPIADFSLERERFLLYQVGV